MLCVYRDEMRRRWWNAIEQIIYHCLFAACRFDPIDGDEKRASNDERQWRAVANEGVDETLRAVSASGEQSQPYSKYTLQDEAHANTWAVREGASVNH